VKIQERKKERKKNPRSFTPEGEENLLKLLIFHVFVKIFQRGRKLLLDPFLESRLEDLSTP